MRYELEEIKVLRKRLGMTQVELARAAGVSQSLIAKIEASKIDPVYSNAQKIFQTLDLLTHKQEKKAEDVMQKRLVSLSTREGIKVAIAKMRKYGISQMPVITEGNVVGLISESTILDALVGQKALTIEEIMEEAPPTVGKKTSVLVVSNLLKFFPMVLVKEKGKAIGVITKADIIASSGY